MRTSKTARVKYADRSKVKTATFIYEGTGCPPFAAGGVETHVLGVQQRGQGYGEGQVQGAESVQDGYVPVRWVLHGYGTDITAKRRILTFGHGPQGHIRSECKIATFRCMAGAAGSVSTGDGGRA